MKSSSQFAASCSHAESFSGNRTFFTNFDQRTVNSQKGADPTAELAPALSAEPESCSPEGRSLDRLSVRRPAWLPSYIPELQGLRGIAVLAVVFYHCHPRLQGTWFYGASLWGWAGVNLFFVLSGFLITSILLESRARPRYFRNFYGRRVLRIWPVYVLLLAVVYLEAPWFIGPGIGQAIRSAPWWAYIFFLQNLFHLALPPALGPTWSLAIEEQYYFLWAPAVRLLGHPRRLWALASLLAAVIVLSPVMRHTHYCWLTPTHTLIHLDGIAWGSLLALGLYTLRFSRRAWVMLGLSGLVAGLAATATFAGGTALLDSALAVAFAGAMLASIAGTGAHTPVNAALARGPLAFYGRISYGLYMIHIGVFIFFGWFDLRMDRYGIAGNLAVVGFRLLVSTAAATVLWYSFESQILRLKKYF
jgi:peptidoglycan/LPS O-acetylase OafA/YrhL